MSESFAITWSLFVCCATDDAGPPAGPQTAAAIAALAGLEKWRCEMYEKAASAADEAVHGAAAAESPCVGVRRHFRSEQTCVCVDLLVSVLDCSALVAVVVYSPFL